MDNHDDGVYDGKLGHKEGICLGILEISLQNLIVICLSGEYGACKVDLYLFNTGESRFTSKGERRNPLMTPEKLRKRRRERKKKIFIFKHNINEISYYDGKQKLEFRTPLLADFASQT